MKIGFIYRIHHDSSMSHLLVYIRFRVEKGKNWRKLQHDTPWLWRMPVFVWDLMVQKWVASSFNASRRWIKDSWWQPVWWRLGPKLAHLGKVETSRKRMKWQSHLSFRHLLAIQFLVNKIHTNEWYWKYLKARNISFCTWERDTPESSPLQNRWTKHQQRWNFGCSGAFSKSWRGATW